MSGKSELPDHLHEVDTHAFCITRKKKGKRYRYYDADKNEIEEHEVLEHLSHIGVPATWTEVRFCKEPDAYILATGYDGSGKLQYLYHDDYLAYRNEAKFSNLYAFGRTLPRIRRRIRRDLKEKEWTEKKLLALVVRVLDKYHLRIGSRIYADKNQSFGLTTLRKKHLKEEGAELYFDYMGKSGQRRQIHLSDQELVKMIHEVADFPGWEIFSIKNHGETIKATSSRVNRYIRDISGEDFTARTFRTWAGTVMSVKNIARARAITGDNPRRKLPAVLTELVAEELGNTPAICREYYIHPGVLAEVLKSDFDPAPCNPSFLGKNLYRKYECRTMEILSEL